MASGDKLYICDHPMCIFSTDSRSEFVSHLEKDHPNSVVPCCFCKAEFPADATLADHIVTTHGLRAFRCGHCSFRALTEGHVKLHHHQHHLTQKPNILKCKTEQLGPLPNSDFLLLPPNPRKAKAFVCGQGDCEFKTHYTSEFENHVKETHKGISVFHCYFCKAEIIQASKFISHQSFHDFFSYHCFHCNYGSNSDLILKIHVATKHPDLPLVLMSRSNIKKIKPQAKANISMEGKTGMVPKVDSTDKESALPASGTSKTLLSDENTSHSEINIIKINKTLAPPTTDQGNASIDDSSSCKESIAENDSMPEDTGGFELSRVQIEDVRSLTCDTELAGQESLSNFSEKMTVDNGDTQPDHDVTENHMVKSPVKELVDGDLGASCSVQETKLDDSNTIESPLCSIVDVRSISPETNLNTSDKDSCEDKLLTSSASTPPEDINTKLNGIEVDDKETENATDNQKTVAEKGTVCLSCNVQLSGPSDVEDHWKTCHKLSEQLKCGYCKSLGTCQEDFIKHNEEHHPDKTLSVMKEDKKIIQYSGINIAIPDDLVSCTKECYAAITDGIGSKQSGQSGIAKIAEEKADDQITKDMEEDGLDNSSTCTEIGDDDDVQVDHTTEVKQDTAQNSMPDESETLLDDSLLSEAYFLADLAEMKQNRLRRAPSSITRLYNEELCTLARGSTFTGKCIQCETTFFCQSKLLDHVRDVHSKGCTYMCSRCDYTVENLYTLQKHLRTVHPKFARATLVCPLDQVKNANEAKSLVTECYMCSKCSKTFSSMRQFHCHFKTKHPKFSILRCGYCQQDSFNDSGFMKHTAVNHPGKRPNFVHNYVKVPIRSDLDKAKIKKKVKKLSSPKVSNRPEEQIATDFIASADVIKNETQGDMTIIVKKLKPPALETDIKKNHIAVQSLLGAGQALVPSKKNGSDALGLNESNRVEIVKKKMNLSNGHMTDSPANVSESPWSSSPERSVNQNTDNTTQSKYICPFCEYDSKYSARLRLHLRSELDYKPFRCRLCKMKATRLCRIKSHLKSNHNTEDLTKYRTAWDSVVEAWIEGYISFLRCSPGPVITGIKKVFHIADAQKEQSLFCPYCDYHSSGLQRTNNIIRHVRSHLRYYPFVCGHCKKAFADYTATSEHSTAHHLNMDISYEIASIPAIDAWIDNMVKCQLMNSTSASVQETVSFHKQSGPDEVDRMMQRFASGYENEAAAKQRKSPKGMVLHEFANTSGIPSKSASPISIQMYEGIKGQKKANRISFPLVEQMNEQPSWEPGQLPPYVKKMKTKKVPPSSVSVSSPKPQQTKGRENETNLLDAEEIDSLLNKPLDVNALVQEVVSRTLKEIESQPFDLSGKEKVSPRVKGTKARSPAQKKIPIHQDATHPMSSTLGISGSMSNPNSLRSAEEQPADASSPVRLPLSSIGQQPYASLCTGLFKCAYCNEGPGTLVQLRTHWEALHNGLMFKVKRLSSNSCEDKKQNGVKCSYCQENFDSLSVLRVHCKERHPGCAVKFVNFRRNQAGSFYASKVNKVETDVIPQPSHYKKTPNPLDESKLFMWASIEGISEQIKVPLSSVFASVNLSPKVMVEDIKFSSF